MIDAGLSPESLSEAHFSLVHLLPGVVVVEQVTVEEKEILKDGLFGTCVLPLHPLAVETEEPEVKHLELCVFEHADLPYAPFLSQQSL